MELLGGVVVVVIAVAVVVVVGHITYASTVQSAKSHWHQRMCKFFSCPMVEITPPILSLEVGGASRSWVQIQTNTCLVIATSTPLLEKRLKCRENRHYERSLVSLFWAIWAETDLALPLMRLFFILELPRCIKVLNVWKIITPMSLWRSIFLQRR